ncbi:DNA polymerase III subunit beta [Alicyclobacillus ferrooxydans]|uniref:Beta sliding clamp n=1 Tax=Alicyclobacillus ferrooxydans TaxID=471514 RepID=A0A0P9EIC6_9BACL|nr:DNA polymerase III subunit beta [Alicyclobacillus ferrooxydans]KPV42510.1 DNA polymerase III subunit beta [Alicyclobacillus ferrooxydans]
MRFSIQQPALLHMLQVVSKAVAVRTPKQVLTGILLEADDNTLTTTAYDLELGIQDTIHSDDTNQLDVSTPGSIVLPARYLSEVIRKLPSDNVSISVNNNYMTSIQCGQVEFHLHGIDAEEFPKLPEFQSDTQIQLQSELLNDFIRSTTFAASNSEVRPILTGTHIQYTDGTLNFTATDGLRLATRSTTFDDADTHNWTAIIPSKSLSELSRLLPDNDTVIDVQLTDSHSLFVIGETYFYTRLIDGTYPDTSRIIPKVQRTEIRVNVKSIASAIDRAALIARDRDNHMVRLEVQGQKMTFSSSSPEIGNVSESVEASQKEGDDFQIAFNAKYVLDALAVFDNTDVLIRFNGSNQPFTIQQVDGDVGLQLISPVLMR